jgi:hypothetical protein
MRRSVKIRKRVALPTNSVTETLVGVVATASAGTAVANQYAPPATGDNADRILAVLDGRSPHFSYSMPADPVTTREVTVTSASQFNTEAGTSGTRILINSSFSGNVTINANDIDVVMSNSATISGRVTIGNNTSYIERIRWTGGNVGELNGIRFRDILFDDLYALASAATASASSPEHNFSRGWDGSVNPPFQRMAFINTTLELEGDPAAPSNTWAWAFHCSQSAQHEDLIFANVKMLSNHQTNRIQNINRLVMVDTVMNPTGTAGNSMRIHAGSLNLWIRDSWGRGLFTMNDSASALVFDNYDRYNDINQYVNQAGGGSNSGTVQNSTLYTEAGAGAFPSISPLTDGGGNAREAWDGSTVPSHSSVGAIR